jgi:hypothetical protein
MDVVAIESALCRVLQERTSRVVVLGSQNAPAPVGEYMSVRVTAVANSGGHEDEVGAPDDDGDVVVQGSRDFTCMLRAFRGDTARSDLERLRTKLFLPSAREHLRAVANIILLRALDMSDVVQAFGPASEPRAAMDLHCRALVTETDHVGRIETVNYTAIYE